MSGTDDLRTAIADVIHSAPTRIGSVRYSDAEAITDRIFAEVLEAVLVEVDQKLAEIERVSPDGGHTAIYAEEAREIIAAALVRPRGEATNA